MNTKLKSLLITIALTFIGCSNNNKAPFTEIVKSSGEIFIKEEKLFDSRHLIVLDEYLIVGNFKNSPLIQVFNLADRQLNNSFLNIGDGPQEVLMIGNMQYIHSSKKLFVADLFKRNLFSFQLEDIIRPNKITPTINYKRGDKSPLMFDKLFVAENSFIAESRDPRGRILLLNKEGHEIGYYLKYPDKENVNKNLSDISNADLYAAAITLNPLLNKVALATYNAGMIDICNIEENNIVSQWNYTEFYPQGITTIPMGDNIAVAHTNNSKNGFMSISSSNMYVYALYSGKLFEDPTYPYGNEVYVVSWDGKKTRKIILDRQINRLAVDSKDEFMYGITPEMDIVKFEIP